MQRPGGVRSHLLLPTRGESPLPRGKRFHNLKSTVDKEGI
jgi:hypothetical protein